MLKKNSCRTKILHYVVWKGRKVNSILNTPNDKLIRRINWKLSKCHVIQFLQLICDRIPARILHDLYPRPLSIIIITLSLHNQTSMHIRGFYYSDARYKIYISICHHMRNATISGVPSNMKTTEIRAEVVLAEFYF